MRKTKLFLLNGVILIATSFFMNTIGLSFNVYISKKIGAEGVGLFQLIMSIYLFVVTISNAGVNIATTRLVTEELTKSNEKGAKKVVKSCLLLCLVFSIIAGFLLIVSSNYIVSHILHSKISPRPLYIIAIALPFISMSSAINGYFSAVRKVIKTASSKIFEQIIRVIITTYILTIFLPGGLEYACLALIIGDVISEVCSFTYLYILYRLENRKKRFAYTTNDNHYKEILKISMPIAFTSFIRSGLSTFKQILIPIRLEKTGMSCESALSQYGLITGMVLPIIFFPSVIIQSFSSLLIPEFSYYYAEKNYDKIHKITDRIFKTTLIFSICVFGIFFTFSDKLSLAIYGNTDTSIYIMAISPLVILIYLDSIVDGILKGLNEQLSVMKCNILDLFISISFIYFLLPIFGINGYVIVLFISEVLNTFISVKQLTKISKNKINYISWIILPISSALLARYIIKILDMNFSYNSVTSLILQILIYILIYLFYLFFTSSISKKDFRI